MYIVVTTKILYKLNFTLFRRTFASTIHSLTMIESKGETFPSRPRQSNQMRKKVGSFLSLFYLGQIISLFLHVKEKNKTLIFLVF